MDMTTRTGLLIGVRHAAADHVDLALREDPDSPVFVIPLTFDEADSLADLLRGLR